MKIAFILSSGHSGSTLLDLLLDGHSKMTGVGEMHIARPDDRCACGKLERECPLWSVVLGPGSWPDREIRRSKLGFLFNRGPYRLVRTGKKVDEQEYVSSVSGAYGRITERTGAQIIVDSSKSPERAELLSMNPALEPIIIHLVRDGRAVTWSYVRKFKKLFPFLWFWGFSNLKIEILRRRFRGAYLFVRYEDLADHPERELTRICTALGIAYEPQMLDFRVGEHHQAAGNRMRFGSDTVIRRDDVWRRDMPVFPRALFFLTSGWLNGYYWRTSASKRSL